MALTAAVFSSHMVLQRDKRVAVFGMGTAGERVRVSVPELQVAEECTVNPDGTWKTYLPAMKGGLKLTMTVDGDGSHQEFTDVVTGEVWLAGGQSNMEFFLVNSNGGAGELKCSDSVNVRCYNVFRNTFVDENYEKIERTNGWKYASEENAAEWSAVAYHAAKVLSEKLGITVGIIGCNLGGTSASCWVPECDLREHLSLKPYLDDYAKGTDGKTRDEMIREYDEYMEYHTAWEKRMQKCYQEMPCIKWDEVIARCGENRYPGPMNIKSPFRPGGTYETMLRRVTPYTIRGFWYYQGENDDIRPETYYTLLTAMIRRWRHDFGDKTLPFILHQLPAFCYEDAVEAKNWCPIREAQMDVYQTVKNTGINVILDCGEFANIHPTDKKPVGERLAAQAEALVYGGSEKAAFGPVYRDFAVEGNTLIVYFDHAEDGMELRGAGEGFELAAEDGGYVPAKAEICGNSVKLTAERLEKPARVRYAWKNYPEYSLFGVNGIPASPFRTCTDEKYDL